MIKLYTPLMFICAAAMQEAFEDHNDLAVAWGRRLARDLIDLTSDTPSPAEFQDVCLDVLQEMTLESDQEDGYKVSRTAEVMGDFIYNAMCNVNNEMWAQAGSFQPKG